MHIKINRSYLNSALGKVSKAVSYKTPIPALSGILFNVKEDMLVLTGSDSDITIVETIRKNENNNLEIYETGSIVISAKYISEIVRNLDSQSIELEIIDGTMITVKGNKSKFDLIGIPARDYPNIDLSKNTQPFIIQSDVLKNAIAKTIFATSDKETRPILTGVNFKALDGLLECVATDSYRLAKIRTSINKDLRFNITIPAKSLNEIARIIEKTEDVNVYVSDRKVIFELNDSLVQTRLIDGAYPETSKLIPAMFENTLSVDSRDILNAINRASLLSSENNNVVNLVLNDNRVVIYSRSQEIGSAEEILEDATFDGKGIEISFSAKYVNDAIKALMAEEIEIMFAGEMKPFILKSKKDENNTQLVLPIRTF